MFITIKTLRLTNFKGVKNLEVNFNYITNIFGENAAGKTTVIDAFLWLFFGKDSSGRAAFGIKPFSMDGRPSEKIDVEVSAIIDVDGKLIEVKKILREKWTKKHGELTPVFVGNENLYYWNDVPVQLKQYQEKVNELINEDIFKLITNPLYFNSLKWQDRRAVLLEIAGEISNEELVSANQDFAPLGKILSEKSLDEYKREIAAKKKKLRDDLKAIPTRIDEINRNMPEPVDFSALRKTMHAKESEIALLDGQLQDSIKAMTAAYEAKRKEQNDLHELKTKAANIKADIRKAFLDLFNERKEQIAKLESEIRLAQTTLGASESNIKSYSKKITESNIELDKLREDWMAENSRQLVFDENEFMCPACKRGFEEDHIHDTKERLTANFNADKAKKLAAIIERSEEVKLKLQEYQTMVKTNEAEVTARKATIESLQTKLESAIAEHKNSTTNSEAQFNAELDSNKEYADVVAAVIKLQSSVEEEVKEDENSELKEKKARLKSEVDTIKRRLNDEEIIAKYAARKSELEKEETTLAQQLADIEGSEYLAEQFTKAQMDILVERINGRFRYVTFKMFDTQINGGTVECCDALINGVPFQDANNAAKINAGLDIINTLCEHYNVYAPIFIDNRESVSELIGCDSQLVNLIVSPADKQLRVA